VFLCLSPTPISTSRLPYLDPTDLSAGHIIRQCVSVASSQRSGLKLTLALQQKAYKKLEPDWWLELDKTYTSRIKQRQDLHAKHGSHIIQFLPGTELACKELMEMALQFLCSRYPSLFSINPRALTFRNNILNTTTDLKEKDPLEVLLDNVPEDFAVMIRDPQTGYYSFRAGVICSSIGWSLGSKIGLGLKDVHGEVPDYREKMEFSMDR
jgi:hypothetical protein